MASAKNAHATAEGEVRLFDRSWRAELTAELANAQTRSEQIESKLAGQTSIVDSTVLRAPADGIIQDLVVSGPGVSVAANEPLMKLVPSDGDLIIKAQVANDDISRVAKDMLAAVKVHAYDFARYGSLRGRVAHIAADATSQDRDSVPTYSVTVLAEQTFLADDPRFAVVPGMIVDVELQAGKRSILSYLTDTLVTYREKAFREG